MWQKFFITLGLSASLLNAACYSQKSPTALASPNPSAVNPANLSQELQTLTSSAQFTALDPDLQAQVTTVAAKIQQDPNYAFTSSDLSLLASAGLLAAGDAQALGQ